MLGFNAIGERALGEAPQGAAAGSVLFAVVGSFLTSGIAVAMKRGLAVISAYGSFSLTGEDTAGKAGFGLIGGFGSFVLTGVPLILATLRNTKATFIRMKDYILQE